MRIGAKVPTSGDLVSRISVGEAARTLEVAGFESLWVSDHVVMPRHIDSWYPFAADGRATWSPAAPWLDAVVALGAIAAATERAMIGTAVLVLPIRHPVELAKQLATVDVLSGGRLRVGAGAGWLREEFDALGVPFDSRGRRLEEWIAILRTCWTGRPEPFNGEHYSLPPGVLCLPTPAHPLPILVGGHSRPALRRAGSIGDGWLGQQALDSLDIAELTAARAAVAAAARRAGRDPEPFPIVLRIVEGAGRADQLARRLPELERAGVDEVIVDVDWDAGDPAADFNQMASAVR